MAEKKHVKIDTQFTSEIDEVALNSDVRQTSTPMNLLNMGMGKLYDGGVLYSNNTHFVTDDVGSVGSYIVGRMHVNISAQDLTALKVSKTAAANLVGNAIFCQLSDQTTGLAIATDGSAVKSTGLQALGTDGTNAQTLATDTSGHLKTVASGEIARSLNEYFHMHVESVAAGLQHFAVAIAKGTNRTIKSVSIYMASAGAGAYFEIARGTVGTHTNIAEAYYGTKRTVTFDKTVAPAATGLIFAVNTDFAGTVNVYITVHYYHD